MNFNIERAISIVINKVDSWAEDLIRMLPNIVVAFFVMATFMLLARGVRLLSQKLLRRVSDKLVINNLFSTLFSITTLGIGLIIALNVLHLQQTVTSLLAGAGIIGLALGFAFQDISANLISGVLIAIRKPIQVGDIIETSDFFGRVQQIDLRVTILQTFQGLHVIIPNKDVFQKAVINYTKTNERRIDLEVGVSYGDDLEKVKKITLDTLSSKDYILQGKPVKLFYHEFGSSSINFTLVFWINYHDEMGYMESRSDAIISIKKAFDENGITIPFPIRTLDFGIKGGTRFDELNLDKS